MEEKASPLRPSPWGFRNRRFLIGTDTELGSTPRLCYNLTYRQKLDTGEFAMKRLYHMFAALLFAVTAATPALSDNVIDQWAYVKIPPAPALKPAIIDPAKTALLLFDFTTQTCSVERRPRCAANMQGLAKLLADARARNMYVVYSVATANTSRTDIMPEIAPREGELVLPSLGPDKFIGSDLEKDFKARGITTLILNGTAAHTTVLHTGASAALRGFDVVVPVDGMASNDSFTEAYTAWHLVNAARVMTKVTLTSVRMISF